MQGVSKLIKNYYQIIQNYEHTLDLCEYLKVFGYKFCFNIIKNEGILLIIFFFHKIRSYRDEIKIVC